MRVKERNENMQDFFFRKKVYALDAWNGHRKWKFFEAPKKTNNKINKLGLHFTCIYFFSIEKGKNNNNTFVHNQVNVQISDSHFFYL